MCAPAEVYKWQTPAGKQHKVLLHQKWIKMFWPPFVFCLAFFSVLGCPGYYNDEASLLPYSFSSSTHPIIPPLPLLLPTFIIPLPFHRHSLPHLLPYFLIIFVLSVFPLSLSWLYKMTCFPLLSPSHLLKTPQPWQVLQEWTTPWLEGWWPLSSSSCSAFSLSSADTSSDTKVNCSNSPVQAHTSMLTYMICEIHLHEYGCVCVCVLRPWDQHSHKCKDTQTALTHMLFGTYVLSPE